MTVLGKKRKTNFFFIALLPLCRVKMLPSKFEANLTLRLRVKHTSFALFPLASSCSNDYFCADLMFDFLANRLVFLNTVTYYPLLHLIVGHN